MAKKKKSLRLLRSKTSRSPKLPRKAATLKLMPGDEPNPSSMKKEQGMVEFMQKLLKEMQEFRIHLEKDKLRSKQHMEEQGEVISFLKKNLLPFLKSEPEIAEMVKTLFSKLVDGVTREKTTTNVQVTVTAKDGAITVHTNGSAEPKQPLLEHIISNSK